MGVLARRQVLEAPGYAQEALRSAHDAAKGQEGTRSIDRNHGLSTSDWALARSLASKCFFVAAKSTFIYLETSIPMHFNRSAPRAICPRHNPCQAAPLAPSLHASERASQVLSVHSFICLAAGSACARANSLS